MQKHIAAELKLARFKKIAAEQSPEIYVYAGNRSCPVRPLRTTLKSRHHLVSLTKGVAERLKLPASPFLIYHSDARSLCIGPVIGVLVSSLRAGGKPIRFESRMYKEMIKHARQRGGLVFLFSYHGTSKHKDLVEGVTTDNKGQWVQGVYPRPDIVYNRIRKRKIEKRPEIQALLKQYDDDPHLFLFNSRYLSKWEVYMAASTVPMVSSLFPFTLQFSRQNLEILLERYGQVLIKPDMGSLGKGIIKVQALSDRNFRFAASSAPLAWTNCRSINDLYIALRKQSAIPEDFLLQQVVDLCRLKGRIFDVRAQFQKDGMGSWVITGAAVRVAGKDQFVTHIPNGGRAEDYQRVIRRIFRHPAIKTALDDQLAYICRHVPVLLEKRLELNLGIVSMDIAIDHQGKMWILEVNSKPSSFDEVDIRRKHNRLLIDYCIHIAAQQRMELTERSGL
ncbi:MAG: YheC/YheD family protein [Syntrophomonadaceae bacterium]|jgi:hypothetical protein